MENEETKICPYCEAEINANAKKCKFCGEWVCEEEDDMPEELNHFNWGAFLFNWIWGIMHGKYITLLYFPACLVPVIGSIAISIWFGIAGNKWAWQSRTWESIEQFNDIQKIYVKLWIILAVFGLILTIKFLSLFLFIANLEV